MAQLDQLRNASRFAEEYRANPTEENARKLRLARWLARDTEGAKMMGRLALIPHCCVPFDHADRKLTLEQYHVLGDWGCERPAPMRRADNDAAEAKHASKE